jgi:VWFA-related protein
VARIRLAWHDWAMRCGVVFMVASLVAQDSAVIRVPVRLVAVPTLVYSRENALIPGLKKADFRLLDNGVPQKVDLDTDDTPVSVVIAIQANKDTRETVPFISKVGSVMEAHLVGETGRAAVIAYNNDIKVLKPFGTGDVRFAFRAVKAGGVEARTIDAGMEAIAMLKTRPRTQARVLLFIGQAMDRGSKADWAALEQEADRENVSIYGLISADAKPDPLSPLIAATGGTELHFRHQPELENAIGALGVELRSAYLLSYYPSSEDAGRHTISVEVSVPGAKTRARPGYMLSPN